MAEPKSKGEAIADSIFELILALLGAFFKFVFKLIGRIFSGIFGLLTGKSGRSAIGRMDPAQLEKSCARAREQAASGNFANADRMLEEIAAANPQAISPYMTQAAIHIDRIAGVRDINATLSSLENKDKARELVSGWQSGAWKAIAAATKASALDRPKAKNLLIASWTCLATALRALEDWENCDYAYANLLEAGATTEMARLGAVNAAGNMEDMFREQRESGKVFENAEARAKAILARTAWPTDKQDILKQTMILERLKSARYLLPDNVDVHIAQCEAELKFCEANVPRLADRSRNISEKAKDDDIDSIRQLKQALKEILLKALQVAPGHPRLLACEARFRELFAPF